MYHQGIPARLPNFFIAGAPKAGTTSLYHYLSQHPQIYMSPVKEPSYFASEVRPDRFCSKFREAARRNSDTLRSSLNHLTSASSHPQGIVCELKDYWMLFREVGDEIAIGEASVCYLWSETAAANIHAVIPGAKIIVILRDPADRAFSQYLHNAADGVVRGSFREHIESAQRNSSHEFHPLYPFLENGQYYEQIQRYLELFPREQILIHVYERAWQSPAALLQDTFRFLQVDESFQPDQSRRALVQRAPRSLLVNRALTKSGVRPLLRKLAPLAIRKNAGTLMFQPRGAIPMEPRDRQYLNDFYREDVEKLESLLSLDLRGRHGWLR